MVVPHLARVNSHVNLGTVCLLTLNSVNVNDPALSVDLGKRNRRHRQDWKFLLKSHLDNFSSLLAFEVASGDHDFVVLSYRQGPHVVFLPQFLGQGCAHDDPAHARRGREMSLSAFSPGGGHVPIELHRADKMAEGKERARGVARNMRWCTRHGRRVRESLICIAHGRCLGES